jgi:uncharacterized protein (TIGR00156 family)
MKKLVLIVVSLTLFASVSLFAGFQGPGNLGDVTTVAQAKKSKDDVKVALTGNIIQQCGNENYTFQDSTGKITLDIDSEKLAGITVTPQTTVKITGEVDKGDGVFGTGIAPKREIDVKSVEVVSSPGKKALGAGFHGPGVPKNVTTVAHANKAYDDTKVVLTGNIIEELGDEHYKFKDSTGEMLLDIDKDKLAGVTVTPQTTVKITGEVDKGDGLLNSGIAPKREIDVKSVEVVSPVVDLVSAKKAPAPVKK